MEYNLTTEAYSKPRLIALVFLRVAIGWHFMYEGLAKALQPNWTSITYLMDSKGALSGVFNTIALDPILLKTADTITIVGLIGLGFMLIVGLWSRWAKLGAMALLLMFFVAQPPLMNAQYLLPGEGNYLWVNKNLIELLALAVLYLFPTGHIIGIGRLYKWAR